VRKPARKILLIDPPTGLYIREDRCQAPARDIGITTMRPPVELAYAAGVLEKEGFRCMMRDYPTEGGHWRDFERDVASFEPDMLIINTTTPTVDEDMFACSLAKKIRPDILTVARGAHFLVYDEEVLGRYSHLDVVLRKEGELTACEIAHGRELRDIAGMTFRSGQSIIRNEDRPFIGDLDALAFPARHLMRNSSYVRLDTGEPQATIQASRGCPQQCVFCTANKLSGTKIRRRSPAGICDEMEECVAKYSIRNFFLRADTFTHDKAWSQEVCREILARGLEISWVCNTRADTLDEEQLSLMKRSGCYAMTMGIESGNQGILDKAKKGITLEQVRRAVRLCKKNDIFLDGYFLIGLPWDTRATVRDSLEFALELDLDAADFFIAYPFPGTELFDMARARGLFNPGDLKASRPYAEPVLRTFELSARDLAEMRKEMFRRFYLRPKYILKTLKRFRSPDRLKNCLRVGARIVLGRILAPW